MNQPKIVFSILVLSIFYVLGAHNAACQESISVEPNYEIVLHTIIASENPVGAKSVPTGLSQIVKKLKESFSFSEYHLASTYIERVEGKGSVEYKGITGEFAGRTGSLPAFNEWSIKRVRAIGAGGKVALDSFRYGTRLPVSMNKTENDVSKTVATYEFLGFTIEKVSLPKNTPTLLGTLRLPNESQMAFVILTIREVE